MSSHWMFGGTDEVDYAQVESKKKLHLNREWNDEGQTGLSIGTNDGGKEEAIRSKRQAQQAYKEALEADTAMKTAIKLENQENERTLMASLNMEGSRGVSSIGMSPSMVNLRTNVKQQLVQDRSDVVAKISLESDPTNSPRARIAAQYEPEESQAFCIGESEDVVRRRKTEQKQIYLRQLDADGGNKRQETKAPSSSRDWDYEVSNGVTGFGIGLGKPSLDMSPSMKNLHTDSKRAKQDAYRQILQQQMDVTANIKAQSKTQDVIDVSEPLPYMRY